MPYAIRIHQTGGPDVLRYEEHARAEPGRGEARIRHTAIGVNFIDVYHRSGLYPVALPSGLGTEAAGVVDAVGPETNGVEPGQRVAYVAPRPGAYAEEALVPAERLVPLPDDISDETAAAILLKGMTTEFLLRRTYPVRAGQTVLLHAAAGGVGSIASQWLRALGATVIGTVGSDAKAELARQQGCHEVIVYTREDFPKRVRELTAGRGVPVVYDSVGRATFLGSLDCLAPRGTLVCFGNASGKPEPLDIQLLAAKGSLYLTRPSLFAYITTREELLASAEAVFEVVRHKQVRVQIGQRWPLADAAEAHRALEARKTSGSLLLIPST